MVVKTIASTTTRSGLRVEAALDPGDYPTGVAISKERFDALPLHPHATHSAWNYTLHPHSVSPSTQLEPVGEQDGSARRCQAMLGRLADPRLTGMTTTDMQQLAALLAPAQPPAPSNATPNSAAAEPGERQGSCAAGHCSTTPHACCSPSSTSGRSAP